MNVSAAVGVTKSDPTPLPHEEPGLLFLFLAIFLELHAATFPFFQKSESTKQLEGSHTVFLQFDTRSHPFSSNQELPVTTYFKVHLKEVHFSNITRMTDPKDWFWVPTIKIT